MPKMVSMPKASRRPTRASPVDSSGRDIERLQKCSGRFDGDLGRVDGVACHKARAIGKECRTQDRAGLESERAARMKGAAGGRIERRGQFALQNDAFALPL